MKKLTMSVLFLLASVSAFGTTTYTEDFEATFPAWESGWFGTNSNAQNYYGIGADRGNNPDGLWITDDTPNDAGIFILFNSTFAQSLLSFSMDVAGYATGTRLEFFDANGTTLSDVLITLTSGAETDPGTYVNYSVNNAVGGIGGFRFYGGSVEGNTSIDNLVAVSSAEVPEPSSMVLLLSGAAFLVFKARRRY